MKKSFLSFCLLFLIFMLSQQIKSEIWLLSGNNKKNSECIKINGQPIDTLFLKLQNLVYHSPDSAQILAKEALLIVEQINHIDWQVRLLNLVGTCYSIKSEYTKALECYHKALKLAMDSDDNERLGDSYNNIGGVHFFARNYTEALTNYLEALTYYELDGDYHKVAAVNCNLGVLYDALGNTEKANYHYKESFSGFEKLKIFPGQTLVLTHISQNYQLGGKFDSALVVIDQAIRLADSIQEIYSLSLALKTKGDIYLALNDLDQALNYYKLSETEVKRIQNKNTLCIIHIGFAKAYLKKGDIQQSENHALEALNMANDLDDEQLVVDCHMLLSKIMETKGNYHIALNHFKEGTDVSNKIMDKAKLHGIYNMEIQHLSKDKEIQKLEIERQQYLIKQRNTMIYIIVLIFLIIIVLIVSLYFLYANKVKVEQQKKINDANLKVAEERAKAALDAEIQERKLLGLELHDRVGPLLSLVKLNITALAGQLDSINDRRAKMVNSTLDTINEILKEIKQISQNMAPIILIEKGFEAAIKNLVVRLNETNNYQVNLDMYAINDKLEPYVEHVLYRSILESINNVLSHAKGTEINIQIVGNQDDITVMIEDNGQGFDVSDLQKNNGLGMKSAQKRIEGFKGNMFVDSKIGKGTIVTFIIPSKTN